MLWYLRDMHDYKQWDEGMGDGGGVIIGDPPAKEYQSVQLQVFNEF